MAVWVIEGFTGVRWLPSDVTATTEQLGLKLLDEQRTAYPESTFRLAEYVRKEETPAEEQR